MRYAKPLLKRSHHIMISANGDICIGEIPGKAKIIQQPQFALMDEERLAHGSGYQERLKRARILALGMGGWGTWCCMSLARLHRLAQQDLRSGEFSFSFRRLADTEENAALPPFRDIRNLLGSSQMLDLLAAVTGRKPSRILQFYISRFDKGHFLSTHCDPGQSFGIAVNLTRQWNPNHGGLTVILDEDACQVRACLVPTFLQVLVFDTSARATPHFVSMVTSSAANTRIAAIARYDVASLP